MTTEIETRYEQCPFCHQDIVDVRWDSQQQRAHHYAEMILENGDEVASRCYFGTKP